MTDITFTSNQDFNNITAGNSLNSIVTLDNSSFFLSITDNDLSSLITSLNQYYLYSDINFIIQEKPTNNSTHQFTISMNFESGKNITITSKDITWE